ncbi:hypothetical protein ASPWEDRAFT_173096 [Aspergillus wentii DTO 134E9]|uniref:Cytochrome P450 n=1 Tax=Aspergillus wentii DTO 134E9 TaxID=1073089 RepID=A0A1L9RFK9_ASPWE|nr:uncharacterized protein ASPWEDRAFT_173096 [Aspergillus wentii DTO 134E9]KAI9925425.1 hypothetical protein MW887_005806 [Aspergillus wentii]OJJ33658.1 hypothetical protein ASPWEDRAFT_173096 [Aspergillus wentii DTO 134E9]
MFIPLLLVLLITAIIRVYRNPTSSIPGPWITNWTGLIYDYHFVKGNGAQYVQELHKKYGPVVRVRPNEVDFADLPSVKEIHRIGSGYVKSRWYDTLGGGGIQNLFSMTDPKLHRAHRRLLAWPLSEQALKQQMEPLIRTRVDLTIQRMKEEMKTRQTVDVCKWYLFMAMDVIAELSFGESFDMVKLGKKTEFSLELEKLGGLAALQATWPSVLRLAALVQWPVFKQAMQSTMKMQQCARESIQRYKQRMADPTTKPTLFTQLFDQKADGLSDKHIEDHARIFIIAGSDTTANTLTYLCWSVCRDEQIKQTLLEELTAISDDFTDADLQRLPYLNQVITEALRLYTSAPARLPRAVPDRGAVLGGYHLPAGATVSTQAYTLHRDPTVYPDPQRFNPSRWANPSKTMKDMLMPFGAGTRICIGMHLAQIELRLATASFFRAFPHARVSAREQMSQSDMEQTIYFLMSPRGKRCLLDV